MLMTERLYIVLYSGRVLSEAVNWVLVQHPYCHNYVNATLTLAAAKAIYVPL